MIANRRFVAMLGTFMLGMLLCLSWAAKVGFCADDHRVEVKVDKKVIIAPAPAEGSKARGMMSMVRHPDGSIYLNMQNVLFQSADNGQTWTTVPVKLTEAPADQVQIGIGVTRSGRLLMVHQTATKAGELYGQSLFVSYSDDGGQTWKTSPTDFAKIPPGIPNMHFHEDGNRTFIEQPDGTLMFTTTITPAPDYAKKVGSYVQPFIRPNYSYSGTPLDFFSDIVVRSYDGGETWGDPSRVYPQLNPHESALAIGPNDPNRILLMSRIQTGVKWSTAEHQKELMEKTGNPLGQWKNGALFESNDGGRTFHMPEGGFTEWYGHRGTINWFKSNVVVVTHNEGGSGNPRKSARISLDGGKTWVDGTKSGTPLMSESTKFLVAPSVSFTCPTVECSENHFMSAVWRHDPDLEHNGEIAGVFWHLEGPGAK